MDIKAVRELMGTLKETQLTEINIEKEGFKLVLKKPKLVPVFAEEELELEFEAETSLPETKEVVCLNIGKFHNMGKGGEKLIKVGDMVKEGQTIGYVETVGLKTEIKSTVSGKVTEILLEDGDIADYGKPVIRVEL